jgi:hypothetical protein
MTAAQFRRLAVGMTGAVEGEHMGHPDFRANGRIFATLHGDGRHGIVKVTPDQQAALVSNHPEAFLPESGAWGASGCTRVVLHAADVESVGAAMTRAWQNSAQAAPRAKRAAAKTKRPHGGRDAKRPAVRKTAKKTARR